MLVIVVPGSAMVTLIVAFLRTILAWSGCCTLIWAVDPRTSEALVCRGEEKLSRAALPDASPKLLYSIGLTMPSWYDGRTKFSANRIKPTTTRAKRIQRQR